MTEWTNAGTYGGVEVACGGKETQPENRVCASVILFCQMGVWTSKKIYECGYYCGVGASRSRSRTRILLSPLMGPWQSGRQALKCDRV